MAKFQLQQIENTETDGKAQFTGIVSFKNNDGDEIGFPIHVLLPVDEDDRNKVMEDYAKNYETEYNQANN